VSAVRVLVADDHPVVRSGLVGVLSSLDGFDVVVSHGPWRPGVGIAGMRERVAELGGACEAGPGPRGGTVRLCVPLESA
jgi:signal transduction histidine kinase